jgi:hypothetical protein
VSWKGKTPTKEQWRDILEKHARWQRGDNDGERADLRGADLRGANLQGANLRGADLRGANLQDANLQGAHLQGADLQGANLQGADLRGANLQDAHLQGAHLQGANLQGANLQDADLQDANLQGADLQGADLQGADLISIRDDLWAVLSAAPAEVDGLLLALNEGRVDGSTYEGLCACLVGTIANVCGKRYDELPQLVPNSRRPAEMFFLGIKQGDTGETNPRVKIAAEWITEWLAGMRAAFGPAARGGAE